MTEATPKATTACPRADAAAAYLDGEMGPREASAFESHLPACADCAAALCEQRRLLCLLDAAFSPRAAARGVDLPADFTRVVAARARADMGGLRSASERALSTKLSLGLAALTALLLGASAPDAVLAPLGALARALLGAARIAGHAALDAGAGLAVILRAVGGRLAAGPQPLAPLYLLVSACALLLLLRLIKSYHRAH